MKNYSDETQFEGTNLLSIQYDTHNVEPEHTHDFVELIYVIKGTVIHRVDDEFYKLERGGVVFINIGQTHSFFSHGKVEFVNIALKSDFFKRKRDGTVDFFEYMKTQNPCADAGLFKQCVQFNEKEGTQFEMIISLINDEYINKKENYDGVISSLFKTLTLLLIRKMFEQQLNPVTLSIKEFIDLRSFDNINIKNIADFFGYNPSYLSRKFKEDNNQTIISYIKENRANAAVILLESTDYSIEVIANIIGYSDVKQIYKLLKSIYGFTPKEIRENALRKGRKEKNEHQ
ncbi:MAG: AraC family transcriptional regulator [Clostridiales bacterium]|nr:AraC family transcriptional regulator [Clostridiales bacterium]